MASSIDDCSRIAIVNPAAGKFLRQPRALQRVLDLCHPTVRVVEAQSEAELITLLNHQERPREVAIVGGDGTLMRSLSCLNQAYGRVQLPAILPVPLGTVCTTAARWGAYRSPWRALEHWIGRGDYCITPKPTLLARTEQHEYIACTVGTGLVAHFFEQYEQLGTRGLAGAARIAIGSFVSSLVSGAAAQSIMRGVECQLLVDDEPSEVHRFTLVVCSVFRDVGLGIKVTYRATGATDRIALVATGLPAAQLGPQFWRVLTGRPLRDPRLIDGLVRSFTLTFPESGPVIIDGDRLTVHKLQVTPGPMWPVIELSR